MKESTQRALIHYLLALKEEGFHRLHVSDIIPVPRRNLKQKWTQFPDIDESFLIANFIEYDRISGWFTL